MSKKAFLEIDMPESCLKCFYSRIVKNIRNSRDDDAKSICFGWSCDALRRYWDDDEVPPSDSRHPDCPLKEKEESSELSRLEKIINRNLFLEKLSSDLQDECNVRIKVIERLEAENEKLLTQLRRAHNIWLEIEQAVNNG